MKVLMNSFFIQHLVDRCAENVCRTVTKIVVCNYPQLVLLNQ